MRWMLIVGLVWCLPQLASARVYMCVDEATGKTTFTDNGCAPKVATGEEVRVDATNLDSGTRYRKAAGVKTWNSDRDERKSGLDYNAERRAIYENRATAKYGEPGAVPMN